MPNVVLAQSGNIVLCEYPWGEFTVENIHGETLLVDEDKAKAEEFYMEVTSKQLCNVG